MSHHHQLIQVDFLLTNLLMYKVLKVPRVINVAKLTKVVRVIKVVSEQRFIQVSFGMQSSGYSLNPNASPFHEISYIRIITTIISIATN